MSWLQRAQNRLTEIDKSGQFRKPTDRNLWGPHEKVAQDAEPSEALVSFASNDYLGLSTHEDVIAAGNLAASNYGAGAGSARLIVGSRAMHSELETELADWQAQEKAVLFSTGYQANLGVLTTFGNQTKTIFSDELNHASIIDGCRLAKAETRVYPHCDLGFLAKALDNNPGSVVVSDSVFSMDGDVAPVSELSEICSKSDSLLILDDAHAVLELDEIKPGTEHIRVGTLSKTLGSLGGYATGSDAFMSLLENVARSYIFTTASTPASVGAARAALAISRSHEGDRLRALLRKNIDYLKPGHASPIIPLILGDEQRAVDASSYLASEGIIVPAIRPPTVPSGTSRLRIAVSAAHSDQDMARLKKALDEVVK